MMAADMDQLDKTLQQAVPICPACRGGHLVKYGKTSAGRQKYRCQASACRRQFVAGSDHLIKPEVKAILDNMIAADVPPKKIAQAIPTVSRRWIHELRRRKKQA